MPRWFARNGIPSVRLIGSAPVIQSASYSASCPWAAVFDVSSLCVVVTPGERTVAAAVTNASRYTVRPVGPLIAGLLQQLALGAPLVVAGAIKAGYDLTLWNWTSRLGLADRQHAQRPDTAASAASTASPGESS